MRTPKLLAFAALTLVLGCKKPSTTVPDASMLDAAPAPMDAGAPDDASTEVVVDASATLGTTTTATPVVDAGHHAVTAPIPFVAGETWNGTYSCGSTPSNMALKVTAVTGNHVAAVFTFHAHGGKSGEFTMSGNYETATRHILFSAGNWIKQPTGFVTVNLDGIVGEDKHSYAGKVNGPGCSVFSSRR